MGLIFVTILVSAGILVFMPKFMKYRDLFWPEQNLPEPIIENASQTLADIESSWGIMQSHHEEQKNIRNGISDEIGDNRDEIQELRQSISHQLAELYYVWREIAPQDLPESFSIEAFMRVPDYGVFAAGNTQSLGDQVPVLLGSSDGTDWTVIFPSSSADRIEGTLSALAQAPDGTLIAAGHEGSLSNPTILLLRSTDGSNWTRVGQSDNDDPINGALFALARAENGDFIAAGQRGAAADSAPMILSSSDGESWSPINLGANQDGVTGGLFALLRRSDDSLVAAGREGARENGTTLVLRSTDGDDWEVVEPIQGGYRIGGELFALTEAGQGALVAAGRVWRSGDSRVLVLWSDDGESWEEMLPREDGAEISGSLNAIAWMGNQTLIGAGHVGVSQAGGPLLLSRSNGGAWNRVVFERAVSQPDALPLNGFETLGRAIDGRILAGGPNGLLISVLPPEGEAIIDGLIEGEVVDPTVIVQTAMKDELERLREMGEKRAELQVELEQQRQLVAAAEAPVELMRGAIGGVRVMKDELDTALREIDPVRQAAQIVTKLAMVGLLIYLMQILLGRNRYHQRLAGFYKARAQAFRIVVASSHEKVPVEGVPLADLTTMLSPDAIGFDKQKEPSNSQVQPTLLAAFLATLLAALRRPA